MSGSIHEQYVTQVFRGQLDYYAPKDGYHSGDEDTTQRPIPPGLSKRDQEALISVRKGYYFLDESFSIFGLRFGWSFILGFCLPFLGATVVFVLAYTLVIQKAEKAVIPKWLKKEMRVNLLFGTVLSMIPFVGRLIAALFGTNTRNELLFEEYMRVRGELYLKLRESGPLPAEKSEGDEWWNVLSSRVGGSTGVTRSDVEHIKPGAGMTVEEIQHGGGSLGGPTDQV